jgi:hypothetical protein
LYGAFIDDAGIADEGIRGLDGVHDIRHGNDTGVTGDGPWFLCQSCIITNGWV